MTTWNVPVPFGGTEAEAKENCATHAWFATFDGEVRCGDCDCKPWHAAANYPCGTSVPRVDVERGEGESPPWVPLVGTVIR